MLKSASRSDKPVARRRTARLLGLALILVGVALALPAGAFASGSGWATQYSGPTDCELFGVAFANANDGWAVGQDFDTSGGFILGTTDGGASSNTQYSGKVGTLPVRRQWCRGRTAEWE